jgi:hypothetical protein
MSKATTGYGNLFLFNSKQEGWGKSHIRNALDLVLAFEPHLAQCSCHYSHYLLTFTLLIMSSGWFESTSKVIYPPLNIEWSREQSDYRIYGNLFLFNSKQEGWGMSHIRNALDLVLAFEPHLAQCSRHLSHYYCNTVLDKNFYVTHYESLNIERSHEQSDYRIYGDLFVFYSKQEGWGKIRIRNALDFVPHFILSSLLQRLTWYSAGLLHKWFALALSDWVIPHLDCWMLCCMQYTNNGCCIQ